MNARLQPGTHPSELADEITTWGEVTTHLLGTLFDTDEEAERFSAQTRILSSMDDDPTLYLREQQEEAGTRLRRLESLLAGLEFFAEAKPPAPEVPQKAGAAGNAVFVVHGHDLAAKHETARLLERLGLAAVILDEQTNRGRTIIEKFEDHAGECRFAVVLLTPDDLGRPRNGTERPRARQNVIFELGYFMAKLGRGKVCALHKGELELPSDIQGVIWLSFDDGSWKLALAKEMRDAGVPVDLNLL